MYPFAMAAEAKGNPNPIRNKVLQGNWMNPFTEYVYFYKMA
jgi:hypothetical protein